MKKVAIFIIDFYKQFLSVVFKSIAGAENVCRFQEHCDDFAKRVITEHGFLKGTYLSTIRLYKGKILV